MGELEQRVRELTSRAVAQEPSAVETGTGDEPVSGTQPEVNRILMSALSGIHDALLEIARAVDDLQSG